MIDKPEEWQRWVDSNLDDYGKAIVGVAREVMALLDAQPEAQIDPVQLITRAQGGLTLFMAGLVAQMVGHYHSRGEEFRLAWNRRWGATGSGTVNPAILTIETAD